ncbi:Myo-inositol transporter [Dirofilaria immitis]
MCRREKSEKIFLNASQFEHRGPLKIENEKINLEQVNDEEDSRVMEKHFTFADQHEVFDIGPEVEVIQ